MKPSKQPPSDEVAAFLSHYGVDERLGRPRERIVAWLARLQPAFVGTDAAALADQLQAQDVRLTVFYLEGLLKLYVARYAELTAAYQRVKALEDALGGMGAARSLTELMTTLAVGEATITWCQTQEATMRGRAAELLAKDWMPDAGGRLPLFVELVATLKGLDFDGYRSDRKTVVSEIRRRLAKLEDTSLDMFELQGNRGLHELRRQLRWIPIYCVALDGLIVTDPTCHPIKAYAELLNSEIANSPYARLPEPTREDKPVSISLSMYLANTYFISELGRLKDAGETVEGVQHALLGSGAVHTSIDAHNDALRLLKRSPEEQYAVHLLAEKLYKELRKRRFLKRLRADFKR